MDNNADFFDNLSQAIGQTAKDLGSHITDKVEVAKLRARITAEERNIEKKKADIGSLIYSRYAAGEVFEGELDRLCLEITQGQAKIMKLKSECANSQGKKICPSCRKEIAKDCLFCPACGTRCPEPEEEPEQPMEEEGKEAEEELSPDDADETIVSFEDYEKDVEEADAEAEAEPVKEEDPTEE